MERNQLESLIRKYNAGQASAAEIDFLEQWYTSFEWDRTRLEDPELLEQLREKAWQEIIKSHTSESAIIRQLPSVTRRIRWVRGIAVACVLLLLGCTAWFLLLKPDTATMPATVKQDVAPGKSGAILTLADGSQMVLDSLSNGIIARQNGAKVEYKDGQVTYNKDNLTHTAISFNTMSTPRGRKYQLTLSDGTRVWLNAASSVTFPTAFSGNERAVTITGEVYFEVAKNARKPFHVTANGMKVEVLGTHFNINAYTDEELVKTTLLEGSVRVLKDKNQQLLTPGQQAQLDRNNNIKLITDADIEHAMAWKNNLFFFKQADLKTVMRQLARWYDVDIVYAAGVPLNKHFEGEIPMDAMLSQILRGLEKNGVHFRIEGKQLTVQP